MRIYKVKYFEKFDSSAGFSFHASKKEANAMLKKYQQQEGENYDSHRSGIEHLEVSLFDNGILSIQMVINLLNKHAGHPDNGGGQKPDM